MKKFKFKLQKIFDVLAKPENESKITKNLLLALLANYLRLIFENPSYRKVYDFLSHKKIETVENFNTALEEAKLEFKNESVDIDIDEIFSKASGETLQAYVNELGKNLSPEKIEKLINLIS